MAPCGASFRNFISAAVAIALALALIRGFARREAKRHQQFLGRSDHRTLHILPISVIMTFLFVWQGLPQNLSACVDAMAAGDNPDVRVSGQWRGSGLEGSGSL